MTEAVWISVAFIAGLVLRQFGLPPLVGYLAAGFALNGLGRWFPAAHAHTNELAHLAHLGVLLLLFTVGLKLRPQSLLQPEVLGGSLLHIVLSGLGFTLVFFVFAGQAMSTALPLAAALTFSSTVIAAKVLESKRELRAFHGRVAIGILIIQDLVALAVLSSAVGHLPSPWALAVLALPLAVPLLHRLIDFAGHDELLVLLGLLLALVAGGVGFEAFGLSAELGALVFGALLAGHSRSQELAKALWSVKELLLIGFFLQIGLSGLPDWQALAWSLLLLALLPLKTALYFFILIIFKLRARSAFLAALSLASYSEFGLIVAAALLPDWTVTLALTVALSFVIAAPLNRLSHTLYERFEAPLGRCETSERHPDEQPVSLGAAPVLVMGMGQLGTAAYDFFLSRKKPLDVVGLDADPGKVQRHRKQGRQVVYADAEDPGFWSGLNMSQVQAVILSLNDREAKVNAARQLRRSGFTGLVVTTSLFDDEAEAITAAGADQVFLAYSEAGVGLAEHVREALTGSD